MSGWVKIHRVFDKWEWYSSPNCVTVFIDILLRANYEDGRYLGVSIPAGSFTTSPEQIAKRTGLTRQQVRTVLTKLKSTNEITIKTTNKFTMISIVKWDFYQKETETSNQQVTNKQPTSNQQVTTSKNLRNKEVKNKRIILKQSPLAFLFDASDPIQTWLLTGTLNAQEELLKNHSHHVLAEEIKKAFIWQCEKKKREAGSFLITWLGNKKTAAFNPKQGQKQFIKATPDNPTGNPYKVELEQIRREKEIS
jgi:hypothetical protein